VYDVTVFFPFIHQRQVTVFCLTFQWYDILFEIRRTERAEHHKDRQYCQVCRSLYLTTFFVCVFSFAPKIGNASGMLELSRSTRN